MVAGLVNQLDRYIGAMCSTRANGIRADRGGGCAADSDTGTELRGPVPAVPVDTMFFDMHAALLSIDRLAHGHSRSPVATAFAIAGLAIGCLLVMCLWTFKVRRR